MQEHAYPASNEPLIFSKTMVGILDDDVIEVRILYRLYHTGTLIKVLDRGKVAQRVFDPGRCAAHVPHASRVPLLRRRAALLSAITGPAARGIRRTCPQSRHHDVGKECFQQGGRSAILCALVTCQFVSFIKLQRRINSAVRILAGIPISFRRAHQTPR